MEVPEELVNQIAHGNCILFVGAGLSQGAKLPSWPDLLRQMLDWSEKYGIDMADRKEMESYIEGGELLLVADEMRERLSGDDFRRFMVEVFRKSGIKPTKVHMLLPKIPFAAALTSNYDTLLESAYNIANNGTPLHVFTHRDYPELSASLRSSEFYVLKVHGTIDRIETIILGRNDYREVMHANPAYRQYLMALFSTKTVIFLGFGLTDPDLLLLLDELRATFKDYSGKHFALMSTRDFSGIKKNRFEKDYGIKIIPYTPSTYEHPEVITFLTDLADKVRKVRAVTEPVIQENLTPLEELTAEVRTWLQTIRYRVEEPQRLDERSMSMIASMDLGTVKQSVIVHCIDGEITTADVLALKDAINMKTPQGWLICDKRISPKAIEQASGVESPQVFNLANFLRKMVWGPYFDSLTSIVNKDKIAERYVDLGCYKQEMDEKGNEISRDRYSSLDAYIDDWLKERSKLHISLLGEFGAGKTWFCRHYASHQLERYLKDPTHERLPLLITLRDFTKASTSQQLINDALLEQYKLPFIGSAFEIFQKMTRSGKLLLILDGFDEMALKVDYQTVVDNFWELAKLGDSNSKVILTSRTEYFRWAKESEKILGGKEFGRSTIKLSPPKFEVLYLEPLSDDQIREIITLRLGKKQGHIAAKRILEVRNLAEMARKPILVELLLTALDEVSVDLLKDPAKVYLYATNKLLLRNINTKRTFTTTADKLYFLSELAWEMIKSGELSIHYTAFPERIKNYFDNRIKDKQELDNWDFDLRNQTLLHRNAAGYYEFAHKSLAEYFVALKFAAELGCLAPTFMQTYCEAEGECCQLPIKQKVLQGLSETFGAMSLMDERMHAVKGLLIEIISEDAAERLWKIVNEVKGKAVEQVKYVGGNAVTLLNLLGENFSGRDLSHRVLHGTDLEACDLRAANLNDTDLTGAWLSDAYLSQASFRSSTLANVMFDHIGGVKSVAFNPEGTQVVSGSSDGSVEKWSLEHGEKILELRGRSSSVSSVRFSPDGLYIASAGEEGIIKIWDSKTGELVNQLKSGDRTGCICFSPNGRYIASMASMIGLITIWDIRGNCKIKEFHHPKYSIAYDIQFSPDGSYIAAAYYDGVAAVWNVANGRLASTLGGHTSKIESLCFSYDGKCIITAGYDEKIKIWEVRTWQEKIELSDLSTIPDIASSPIDNIFATALHNGYVSIWDIAKGRRLRLLDAHKGATYALAFSHDGQFIATGGQDATIRIFSVQTGDCVQSFNQTLTYHKLDLRGAKRCKSDLLEILQARGAILDEKQKQILVEHKRKSRKVTE